MRERFRESGQLRRRLWSSPSATEQGKAFCIIPNYRHLRDLHVAELAEWRATFGAGRAYNFDYVTCCGGNASGSVGKCVGENGFFIRRAGKLLKMQALEFYFLLLLYGFLDGSRYRFFCFGDFVFPKD